METVQTYDEETVQLQLDSGDDAQINDAIAAIDQHLKEPLCGAIRGTLTGISAHDLADAWEQTLVEIWRAVKREGVDLRQSLGKLIFTVLRRRVIDCLRKNKAERLNSKEYVDHWRRSVPTRHGQPWSDAELDEGIQVAIDAFDILPPKQRLVTKTFYAGRPGTEDMRVLRDEVAKQTGPQETVVAVTRALKEALTKIKAHLISKDILRRNGHNERGETGS